jgi:hypothetical protein
MLPANLMEEIASDEVIGEMLVCGRFNGQSGSMRKGNLGLPRRREGREEEKERTFLSPAFLLALRAFVVNRF